MRICHRRIEPGDGEHVDHLQRIKARVRIVAGKIPYHDLRPIDRAQLPQHGGGGGHSIGDGADAGVVGTAIIGRLQIGEGGVGIVGRPDTAASRDGDATWLGHFLDQEDRRANVSSGDCGRTASKTIADHHNIEAVIKYCRVVGNLTHYPALTSVICCHLHVAFPATIRQSPHGCEEVMIKPIDTVK